MDSIYDDIEEKYDPLATVLTSVSAPVLNSTQSSTVPIHQPVAVIFSDDDDGDDNNETTMRNSSLPIAPPPASAPSLKGLFHNIRQTAIQIPSKQTFNTKAEDIATVTSFTFQPKSSSTLQDSGDVAMDAVVSKLEKAKRRREDLKVTYGSVQEFQPSVITSTDTNIIHRDVFATTIDNIVEADRTFGKKVGDAFGLQGEYDLFPETGGEVEVSIYILML